MQNLVKIQEELKNVPLQAVMSYVNGRNPMVPPYLALTELNRRKQIQQSSKAQQQPQPTVKDQIQQDAVQQQAGIMALQNQRAQAGMQNMAQSAAQMPQPGAVPQNAPVQGEPAMPPVVKAATGGLMGNVGESRSLYAPQGVMQLPTPGMFQQSNFAGGGIVAFQRGGETDVDEEEETPEERERRLLEETPYMQRVRAVTELPSTIAEFAKKYSPIGGTAYGEGIRQIINQSPEDQAKRFRAASMRPEGAPSAVPTATERTAMAEARTANDLAKFDEATALLEKDRAVKLAQESKPSTEVVPPRPVVAKQPVVPAAPVAPTKDVYEQEAENLAKLKERFGVKEGITSESDKMIADLRKRIDEQRSGQGLEALGKAMARGAKGKEWYEAASGFGEGYFEATDKQRELNNKQDEAFANLQVAKEKEDDARRRGDMKAVQEAVKDKRKADVELMNAQSVRIQAMKPSQLAEQIKLFKEDPKLYAQMYPKENPLVIAAAKEYFEKEQLYKKDYPTVGDYLRAKGLSASGDTAGGAPSAPVTVSVGGKTYSFPNQEAADKFKKQAGIK